jgi:O-antigen ligase
MILLLRTQWPLILLLLVPVLLPFGRSAEVPLSIAAIIGVILLLRRRRAWRKSASLGLVLVLFGCYWLPTFFSAFDSVVPVKSWETVAADLRFLPFAVFTGYALRQTNIWPRAQTVIALIVLLWLLDAWLQILTGFSLGGAADKQHLSGIFGADNLKLGPVLAVLSPFLLLEARTRFSRAGLIAAFLLLLVPILLAGERASWLSFALVCLIMLWRETRAPLRFLVWCTTALAGACLVIAIAWQTSPGFAARMQRSLLVLQGTHSAVDEASAGRLRIWHTALAMGAAHPLNGVGVRGFRYAYATYAEPGDFFVDPVTHEGASHAHQLLLELLSETGLIGVLAWLIGAWFAIRAWWRADVPTRLRALVPGLALIAMCFPLNTHLAFYSAWWGSLFWWLLALYCAALQSESHEATNHVA